MKKQIIKNQQPAGVFELRYGQDRKKSAPIVIETPLKSRRDNTPVSQNLPIIEVETKTLDQILPSFQSKKEIKKGTDKNSIRAEQQALWDAGAFKGIKNKYGKELSYKEAVDGLEGKLTRQARANYQSTSRDWIPVGRNKETLREEQEALWNAGAFKGLKNKFGREVSYKEAVDGIEGSMTRQARENYRETVDTKLPADPMGYIPVRERRKIEENAKARKEGIAKQRELAPRREFTASLGNIENSTNSAIVALANSYPTGYHPGMPSAQAANFYNSIGQKMINSNPALALLNAKAHGQLGIDANYTSIPEDHIKVLSDQNQFIYDNWKEAMEANIYHNDSEIASRRNNISKGYRGEDPSKTLSVEEIKNLQKEIKDLEQSSKNIQNLKRQIYNAGGLEKYLISNPGEKVIIGGNFRFYKDNNQKRFPKNTPNKYANFNYPGYALWAMETPLGNVETIYGNNVQSFMYDPETKTIKTRFSDGYNFNAHGANAESSEVKKLRAKVGQDPDLAKTAVRYSSDLIPITIGKPHYLSSQDFGTNEHQEFSWENPSSYKEELGNKLMRWYINSKE